MCNANSACHTEIETPQADGDFGLNRHSKRDRTKLYNWEYKIFNNSINTVRVIKWGKQEKYALLCLNNLEDGDHMGILVSN